MFTLRVADVFGAVVSGVMDIRLHRMWVLFGAWQIASRLSLPIRRIFISKIFERET
jgi:hypothetical protein